MNEQEEVDANAGNAVEYPRPHSFAAPIQGPSGNNTLTPGRRDFYRDRHGGLLAG
jgi:hypothetical protein